MTMTSLSATHVHNAITKPVHVHMCASRMLCNLICGLPTATRDTTRPIRIRIESRSFAGPYNFTMILLCLILCLNLFFYDYDYDVVAYSATCIRLRSLSTYTCVRLACFAT